MKIKMIRISVVTGLMALVFASPVLGAETVPKIQSLRTKTGVEFFLMGNKPAAPATTVITFGGDAASGIGFFADKEKMRPFLVKRGYVVVSLDSPETGRNRVPGRIPKEVLKYPKGKVVFNSWRYRIEAKDSIFPEFNQKVSQVLDYLIAEGYTDPDRVATMGGSIGAFVAYHYAASDPRVKCVSGHIPLTDLRVLGEFKGMENDPLTKSLEVSNLAKKFAGHQVQVLIGKLDRRVNVDLVIAFAKRVSKEAPTAKVDLHVLPGGHVATPRYGKLAEAWLDKNFPPKALK